MKLSALEEYGLRCLLRVSKHDPVDPCRIQEIADGEGLSQEYVAKIMRVLRQGDLVVSVRGALGGYHLARPADMITVWEAMQVLDGPLFTDEFCINHTGNRTNCVHNTACSLRVMWRSVAGIVEMVLQRVTLADLARGEFDLQRQFTSLDARAVGLGTTFNETNLDQEVS